MTLLFRNIGKSSASTHLVVIEKRIRTREANKFRFRFLHDLLYDGIMVVVVCSCKCAGLCALLRHASEIEEDTGISMLVCFDHEEIGSDSAQGELIVPGNFLLSHFQ
jgi:hypothetical protein